MISREDMEHRLIRSENDRYPNVHLVRSENSLVNNVPSILFFSKKMLVRL